MVCHGDLCLDNVLIDPSGPAVSGVLDVGRLGTADRWLDLAVTRRNIAVECAGRGFGPADADRFLRSYGCPPDERRDTFYRLLDEFV